MLPISPVLCPDKTLGSTYNPRYCVVLNIYFFPKYHHLISCIATHSSNLSRSINICSLLHFTNNLLEPFFSSSSCPSLWFAQRQVEVNHLWFLLLSVCPLILFFPQAFALTLEAANMLNIGFNRFNPQVEKQCTDWSNKSKG